jgi:hypothetical protein
MKRIFTALLAAASLLSADTLVLHNGSTINGKFIGGDSRSIRFSTGSQVNTYDLVDIDTLRFDNSSAAAGGPPPSPNTSLASRPSDAYAAPSPAPGSNGPLGLEIAAGTQVLIRLIDPADSERDRVGQTYRATVDQPVMVNGQTAIPRNADAVVTLTDAQQSGKIQGKAVLTLDLKSITVNGRSYDIASSAVSKASGSRGTRSAEVIGGTAALGAIIGAIAGGGKGAAIGAGSGAAVGTVAQVATSGQKVKVPAETQLTFTLQNPLDL